METSLGKLIRYLIECGVFEMDIEDYVRLGFVVSVDGVNEMISVSEINYADSSNFLIYSLTEGGRVQWFQDPDDKGESFIELILYRFALDNIFAPAKFMKGLLVAEKQPVHVVKNLRIEIAGRFGNGEDVTDQFQVGQVIALDPAHPSAPKKDME